MGNTRDDRPARLVFVPRRVLFAVNLAAGTHTIVIKALGTTGRPMVAIDAFETRIPG